MTKEDLMNQLKEIDDNAEITVAYEGQVEESQIVNVSIEDGVAVIEIRDEE